ncbi:ammonium transporter [Geodermatophilus sabuli]|uniref:Ammonium transporter n=1 Tax=Geodermatophilus sabuli TaxID=1564158 RepID=A0A285EJ44_9ACTN|nr:ammonium transporter [Geodermatophilus sabuli]MBB3083059.1 ammonia channel protein AmtB [Geodermatophilus sabuli]SNX98056.1 ammonium transporter [Geodermatophilus sabuli]
MFEEQATFEFMTLAFVYVLGVVAIIMVVLGLGLVDAGLVRRQNVVNTWVQKLVAVMIAGAGLMLGGYALWQWQFNQAFGVPDPLSRAVSDWWLFGAFMNTPGNRIDPAVLPEADVLQVFVPFFATFGMATMALIHSGVVERIRSGPLYVMSFVVGAVLSPLAGYLCWGSLSPLTNRGVHDYDGVFPLYIFAGTFALVLAWRLRPRLGAFTPHPSGARPMAQAPGLVAVGVLLILFAKPIISIGSGYIIPGQGYFGISMTSSGIGLVMLNWSCAVFAGGVVGGIIAHRQKNPTYAFLGPVCGLVICGALFDVGRPWECLVLGAAGPLVALGTAALMRRLRIDESKVVPLALGPGIVGAIATGFFAWGEKTGGYFGLEGEFGFQHAEITPWWQLVGVVTIVLLAGVPALVMALFFERIGGLRVDERVEIAGQDPTLWGLEPEAGRTAPVPAQRTADQAPAEV